MTSIPLADPPTDLTAEEGVRAFVKLLHQDHRKRGLTAAPVAYLGVRRHPATGELFEGVKLLQVKDQTDTGSLSLFAAVVRKIALHARGLVCVTVFPLALADDDDPPAPFEAGALVLAYLVEHTNDALNARCWYASLTVTEETDEPIVGEHLEEHPEPAEVVGDIANLLPQRSLN